MGLIDHQENMKVRQQFARGFSWDHHNHHHINNKHCKFNITPPSLDSGDDQYYEPSLSLAGCKRLRPLAPKLPAAAGRNLSSVDRPITSLDLKSFIRPDSAPRKLSPSSSSSEEKIRVSTQVETHPGGTRWNPTQEQIGILEMLYREGMRTPNAQQIEQITAQLSKYGKIEGKNVFYWFQNHKARERQKLKRNNTLNGGLGLSSTTTQTRTAAAAATTTPPLLSTNITPSITLTFDKNSGEVIRKEEQVMSASCKRMCDKWTSFECCLSEENFENITTLITTSPRHHDHIVHPASHNYSTDDQGKEGADKKTLDLFPLHPEGR